MYRWLWKLCNIRSKTKTLFTETLHGKQNASHVGLHVDFWEINVFLKLAMKEQYILCWSAEPFHNKIPEFKNCLLKFNGFEGRSKAEGWQANENGRPLLQNTDFIVWFSALKAPEPHCTKVGLFRFWFWMILVVFMSVCDQNLAVCCIVAKPEASCAWPTFAFVLWFQIVFYKGSMAFYA